MQTVQIQLNNLPLTLTCIMEGTIALSPNQHFKALIDGDVKFDMSGFSIGVNDYLYNQQIEYKEDEKLLKWLQSLNMTMPSFQHQGFGFTFQEEL